MRRCPAAAAASDRARGAACTRRHRQPAGAVLPGPRGRRCCSDDGVAHSCRDGDDVVRRGHDDLHSAGADPGCQSGGRPRDRSSCARRSGPVSARDTDEQGLEVRVSTLGMCDHGVDSVKACRSRHRPTASLYALLASHQGAAKSARASGRGGPGAHTSMHGPARRHSGTSSSPGASGSTGSRRLTTRPRGCR
jgi:hypothetical protein